MGINEILLGTFPGSFDEQKESLNEMKERKFFDLSDSEKNNLVEFLCEKTDVDLAIDYLFHVLDEEVSYPVIDEQADLFSDERMLKLRELMLEKVNNDFEDSMEDN